jgi:CDP-glycerol glycerophosphotransferase (TagB/SpsB family)
MVFRYDGFVVWSEEARRELHHAYPYSRRVPTYVVGAPQFDVFFQEQFHQSRETFCAEQGLRADRPILLYAVGSPNFIREQHGALEMARRVMRGDLGDVQMLVRPHPIHDRAEMKEMLREFHPRVVLQQTAEPTATLNARFQDERQTREWINTFRHADVVVNLSSTVTIDAAIFDRPVVNLDYDPEPGQPNQALVKDVNHLWTHFKPIAESGGVWLVNNPDETVAAVKGYLAHPELHRDARRWIAEYVCGYLDGRCGERMAQALLDFAGAGPARAQPVAGAEDLVMAGRWNKS